METMFLQDKGRIVLSATFSAYKRTVYGSADEDKDALLSIRFENEQWEIMAQNGDEKRAIVHLLECAVRNMSAEAASELGKRNGVIGVEKDIMKSGLLIQRSKTAYKKNERLVIIVPGKLLLFLISPSQQEFEVLVPNTKVIAFRTVSAMEGLSSWVKMIEASANGESLVYSDDSDDLNRDRNYEVHSHRPLAGNLQTSQYNGGYQRYQQGEGDCKDHVEPSRRPLSDGSSVSVTSYESAKEGNNYQSSMMPETLVRQQAYYAQEPYGAAHYDHEKISTVPNEDCTWKEKTLKNLKMRRRSVPLQCLDSALDEMTVSIGKMTSFHGSPLQGTITTATSRSNLYEPSSDYTFQSSNPNVKHFMLEYPSNLSSQAGTEISGKSPFEYEQGYYDPNGYMIADARHVQINGNEQLFPHSAQFNYDINSQQSQSQGNELLLFKNQSNYSAGPKENMGTLTSELSSAYGNQQRSGIYDPQELQVQSASTALPHYIQDGYTTISNQVQLEGAEYSASDITHGAYHMQGANQMSLKDGSFPVFLNAHCRVIGPNQAQIIEDQESVVLLPYANQHSYSSGTKHIRTPPANASYGFGYHTKPVYDTSNGNPPMIRSVANVQGVGIGQFSANLSTPDPGMFWKDTRPCDAIMKGSSSQPQPSSRMKVAVPKSLRSRSR
ncbi:hypothetical protein KP509_14G091700 [Ceratopteris richardii]|uniref:Uncharacterized protein n=1 Tax=Ceratopteris richardii TaxID=49495 RepID=A0A8T2TFC6_CERRI|nr:hypothetical protein KP509_14G091700 [Ceratopteris richardii]